MTDKTVDDILTEHGAKESEILIGYEDAKSEARAIKDPDAGPYLERLNSQQRRDLLYEQKSEKVDEAYQKTVEAYTEEVDRHEQAVESTRAQLKEHLFHVAGPDGAAALSRTITASEGELEAYLDVAQQAGNEVLAKAVFVAAERRGLGNIMNRYFTEVAPEAASLYEQWTRLPSKEDLAKQRENIGRLIQPPDYDSLMPSLGNSAL